MVYCLNTTDMFDTKKSIESLYINNNVPTKVHITWIYIQ